MRVLVVDESPERAELLRETLTQAGYEVAASLSPPLALLKAVEDQRPDVIVVDAGSLLNVVARFEELQGLRAQLAEANRKLTDRKLVERAKGLLMKTRSLDEDAAYTLLRKMAMDRKLRLAEVARKLVDAADLLGA